MGNSTGTDTKTVGGPRPAEDTPPKLPYWHVWTDDDGINSSDPLRAVRIPDAEHGRQSGAPVERSSW